MNERDFKLLIRAYFQSKDRQERLAQSNLPDDLEKYREAIRVELESEKEIRKELDKFTRDELNQLPFK